MSITIISNIGNLIRKYTAQPGAQNKRTQSHPKSSTGGRSGNTAFSQKDVSNSSSIRRVLPDILISNRHLREITADAKHALERANVPPKIFIRGGSLVRLRVAEKQRASIEILDENKLRSHLERSANYIDGKSNPKAPPTIVVKDFLAQEIWGFPSLVGIVETPVLRSDGSILSESGYDSATELFLQPDPKLEIDPIPEHPSPEQVQSALALLEETIIDYPFVDEASKANALGLLITPIVRPAINGNVPLALVDAPQRGTAKSLLCKIVSVIATGSIDSLNTAPNNSEEWRKRITSTLLQGDTIIIIDNVGSRLDSSDLAAALTTTTWSDRRLGRNEMISVPQNSTWMANGNNIQLGGDLIRRSYWIRLDAKMSRPYQRENFKHDDLEVWVSANRGRLIWAILSLARAWIIAGKPSFEGPTFGGFTDWTQVVGGILDNVGVKGFLGNIDQMHDVVDEEGSQWETFLSALHERFCGRTVIAREICQMIADDTSLADTVPDELEYRFDSDGGMKPQFAKKLGSAFRRKKGTRYGQPQIRVERAQDDTHANVARWRIVCGECGDCGDPSGQGPQEPENLQSAHIQQISEGSALVDLVNPSIPAQTLRKCHTCGESNWRTRPNNKGEYCATCHPNYLIQGGKQ